MGMKYCLRRLSFLWKKSDAYLLVKEKRGNARVFFFSLKKKIT